MSQENMEYKDRITEMSKNADAFLMNLRLFRDEQRKVSQFSVLDIAVSHMCQVQHALSNELTRLKLKELREDI